MTKSDTFSISDGFTVPRFGYGAMRLTGQPGNFGPYADWEDGKRLLRRVMELGIRFIDTARAYGPGGNEKIIPDALHPYPEDLFIATKGGVIKKSATERYLDASLKGLRRDCEAIVKHFTLKCLAPYELPWSEP